MKRLRLSRFTRVFQRDDAVAIVNELLPQPLYLQASTWAAFHASPTAPQFSDLREDLLRSGNLIQDGDSDVRALQIARATSLQALNRPSVLYLMMSQGCNLECVCCPIPSLAREHGATLLSFESLVSGIQLWERHIGDCPPTDQPYLLVFYGGEPLLNREVFERGLIHVSERRGRGALPNDLEVMLCTNGLLLDSHLIALLARHQVTVAVGWDGPAEHHDTVRVTPEGEGTHAAVERTIGKLVGSGIRVVASVMVTPHNVDALDAYPQRLRNLGVSQFGFNLMKGKALTRLLGERAIEDYARSAARGVLAGLPNRADGAPWFEYQLGRRVAALQSGAPFSAECCYGGHFAIQADGQVTACPFIRADLGHVQEISPEFRIAEVESIHSWRRRIPLFRHLPEGEGLAEFLYGGGCIWSALDLGGDATGVDPANQMFSRELARQLVWNLLPGEYADAIRNGATSHWRYRRIGPL